MRLLLRIIVTLSIVLGLIVALDYALPHQAAAAGLKLQRTMAGLERKQAQIPGFDIAYLEGGSGAPLVLVHGFGADKDNFSQSAVWLTRHYRVIAVDMPGFGESSKPADADYSVAAQVARLDAILAALGVDKAHFGGSSMGGWIVASYASAHPEKVQSLWLLAAAGATTAKESEVRRAYRETQQISLVARTPEDFERITDLVFSHRPFAPHSVLTVLAERAAANYELHSRIFQQLAENTERDALEPRVKDLPTPTLLMWGDQDRAVDVSSTEVLDALMPNAEVVVYPGVGHLPMLETPRRAAQDYIAFREKLGA